jgi:hypothetical protein
MGKLAVRCRECDHIFEVKDEFGGEIVFCPKCWRMTRAPGRGARGVSTTRQAT